MGIKSTLICLFLFGIALSEDYPYENKIPERSHPYLHFLIPGISSFIVTYGLKKVYPKNPLWLNITMGSCVGLSEGLAKEFFDVSKGYKFNYTDMAWACSGILTFQLIFAF